MTRKQHGASRTKCPHFWFVLWRCLVRVSAGTPTSWNILWSSQCLKRHAKTEPQITDRSRSVPSTSPPFRYCLSSSHSMLQSKLLTNTFNWQITWLRVYRVESHDRTYFPGPNTFTLSGIRDHYSFNDIFSLTLCVPCIISQCLNDQRDAQFL